MADLQTLQNKRQELAAEIRNLAKTESSWNAEDKAKWAEINAAYDTNKAALDAEVAAINASNARRAEINNRLGALDADANLAIPNQEPIRNSLTPPVDTQDGNPVSRQGLALQGWFLNSYGMRNRITEKHRNAASALGLSLDDREFVINLGTSEQFNNSRAHWLNPKNAMTIGQPQTGGFTVGQTLVASLERAMLDFSGVMQVAEILRTDNGEPLSWPTLDDTANTGNRVGESQDAGTASDPVTGRVTWNAYDYSSGLLNVSRSLLADSIFNLEQVIGQMLGERLGRKQNTDYTTGGGGGNSPRGIVSAAAVGKTGASTSAIVWDEVIDLEHSIDPSRRNMPGVGYMLHDSILQALRKLKDGNGQPIWQSGWNAGLPDRLNNRLYWINQAMASSVASGAKTILFGQLSAYKVRQVGQLVLQRLIERRAEYNQDVFIAYMRGDGNLLNAGDDPVKYLTH